MEKYPCFFNPASFTVSKSNEYDVKTIVNRSYSPPTYVGGQPRRLKLELLFARRMDDMAGTKDVQGITDKLLGMMEPWGKADKKLPPLVTFKWGAYTSFPGVPQELEITYDVFEKTGEPIRARVKLTILQAEDDPKTSTAIPAGQNPTTRSAGAGSSCVVALGDSLPSLAFQAYGDPTAWRTIAQANGIDNPLALTPGRRITIPESPA